MLRTGPKIVAHQSRSKAPCNVPVTSADSSEKNGAPAASPPAPPFEIQKKDKHVKDCWVLYTISTLRLLPSSICSKIDILPLLSMFSSNKQQTSVYTHIYIYMCVQNGHLGFINYSPSLCVRCVLIKYSKMFLSAFPLTNVARNPYLLTRVWIRCFDRPK